MPPRDAIVSDDTLLTRVGGCNEPKEVVAIDRAYKAVLQHASASKADLIAMGTQGMGGLELMMFGSNTQHVVRAATCTVLIVRA